MVKLGTFKLHLKCEQPTFFSKSYFTVFKKHIMGEKNVPIWQIYLCLRLISNNLPVFENSISGNSHSQWGLLRFLSQSFLDELLLGLGHQSMCDILKSIP